MKLFCDKCNKNVSAEIHHGYEYEDYFICPICEHELNDINELLKKMQAMQKRIDELEMFKEHVFNGDPSFEESWNDR